MNRFTPEQQQAAEAKYLSLFHAEGKAPADAPERLQRHGYVWDDTLRAWVYRPDVARARGYTIDYGKDYE